MRDVIDRTELIKQIRLMANRSSLGETRPSDISGIEVCGLIFGAPSLDIVPAVYAEWEYVGGNKFAKYYRCTNCTGMYDFTPPYCPACSSKMDDKEKTGD